MNYQRIPQRLRQFNQWVIWRAEDTIDGKPTKVPYQSNAPGKLASVTDPSTWGTFDEAVAASKWASGIGFVLTRDDPFTGIDLDKPDTDETYRKQLAIYQAMQSYSELSPSGEGLHIIIEGYTPAGRRFRKIEVYPHGRFLTMTGNVFQIERPIENRQYVLDTLVGEMNQLVNNLPVSHHGDALETASDLEIYNKASEALDGDKFLALWQGQWAETINTRTGIPYPSQSEADLAIVNMLAFYTQNAVQITRMFWQSALGKRDKASRGDYVSMLINRAFDRIPPPVNIDLETNKLNDAIAANVERTTKAIKKLEEPSRELTGTPYTLPPGIIGRIATWCYQASPRPVAEIALAAALAFVGGIVGRQFNISNTGLNQYIMVVAPTGIGKEAMASTIDRLVYACSEQVPSMTQFRGPAAIASGQGLIRFLEKQPSIVSIISEFGYRLQALSSERASSAELMLKSELLNLYGKSGAGQIYYPIAYSDTNKNTTPIHSPAFTLLGEGTPDTIYENVTSKLIRDGLLPRFTIIEYLGKRVPNNDYAMQAVPDPELIKELSTLATDVLKLMTTKTVIHIALDADALKLMKDFDLLADNKINSSDNETTRELWTRVYVKALKLAGVVAVGINHRNPRVDKATAEWAIRIIKHEVNTFIEKLENNEVSGSTNAYGRNEADQVKIVAKAISQYITGEVTPGYKIDQALFKDHVIPYAYLMRRCHQSKSFVNDRADTATIIKRALQYLIDTHVLTQLNGKSADFIGKYGVRHGLFYFVTDYDAMLTLAKGKV